MALDIGGGSMGIRLTPFGSRSYHVAGGPVSRTYHFVAGEWTEVTNPSDLAYLLSNENCILQEEKPLGNKAIICRCDGDKTRARFDDAAAGVEYYREYEAGRIYSVPLHEYKVLNKRQDFQEVDLVTALSDRPRMRVLIVRPRGLGDLLLSLPAVAAIHKRFPNASIVYSCDAHYRVLFFDNPAVTRAVEHFEAYDYAPYDYIADWTYGVENHPRQASEARPDLFAEMAGITNLTDYSMLLKPMPSHVERVAGLLPDSHPLVAVHVRGANFRRVPSQEKLVGIVRKMVLAGMTPVCLHHVRETIWDIDGVVNLTGRTDVGDLVAVVDACDAALVGDSGVTHVANALSKPTLALYGHVDYKLRIKGQPNCTVIQGNSYVGCPPCNDHQTHRCDPPPRCLDMIPDEVIIERLKEVVKCR